MQIAIIGAGFSPTEADRLRRSLATFKKHGSVSEFRDRFLQGHDANGHDPDFAARCFAQIEKGFGSYGFPESHAASFALLVYASAWRLKRHHPGIFACALLNSQPMGFYAPAQIVRDAREHGVRVLPVCINASSFDCTMDMQEDGALALRLGFRQIRGLAEDDAQWIVAARGNGYQTVADVWHAGQGFRRRCWCGWPRRMPLPPWVWTGGRRCGRCAVWRVRPRRVPNPCRCLTASRAKAGPSPVTLPEMSRAGRSWPIIAPCA